MTDAASRPAGPPPGRCRARDLGIAIGLLPTGPTNNLRAADRPVALPAGLG